MTFRNLVHRRFALSDDGYMYFRKNSLTCVMHDIVLMLPVVVLFLFSCNILDEADNPYEFDLNMWAYDLIVLATVVLMGATYYVEYNESYFNTYEESAAKRSSLVGKIRKLPMSFFGQKEPTNLIVRIHGRLHRAGAVPIPLVLNAHRVRDLHLHNWDHDSDLQLADRRLDYGPSQSLL